jgi:hypothetical protein
VTLYTDREHFIVSCSCPVMKKSTMP